MSAAISLRAYVWTSLWLCLMPLDAVEIDVAAELERIEYEATILAEPFVFSRRTTGTEIPECAGRSGVHSQGKRGRPDAQGGARCAMEARFHYHTPDSDLYGHFYVARAMYFRGGDEWKAYHEMVFPDLLEAQGPDGSWPPPGKGEKLNAVASSFQTNAHYRNCLCLLILESYYRTAPVIPIEEGE